MSQKLWTNENVIPMIQFYEIKNILWDSPDEDFTNKIYKVENVSKVQNIYAHYEKDEVENKLMTIKNLLLKQSILTRKNRNITAMFLKYSLKQTGDILETFF